MTTGSAFRFPVLRDSHVGFAGPKRNAWSTSIPLQCSTRRTGFWIWEEALLYFAYNARIAPDRMAQAAPSAKFQLIAHLPEWGLDFPIEGNGWDGRLPTVVPETGSTVWGAVFFVPDKELDDLHAVEQEEQRVASTVEAMDRNGRRHQVMVHVANGSGSNGGSARPSAHYLRIMLDGSRHWNLPFGYIAGLEEHLQNA